MNSASPFRTPDRDAEVEDPDGMQPHKILPKATVCT
jgi:hypothetical protein